jgi:hypothetical protein
MVSFARKKAARFGGFFLSPLTLSVMARAVKLAEGRGILLRELEWRAILFPTRKKYAE